MLDLVVVDGRARGIITRDLVTGEVDGARGRRRRARHGRIRQRVLPLDEREGVQRHRDVPRVQEGRGVRQSVLHADPSDVHPGRRRAPVEAHADVRVAAQRRPRVGAEAEGRLRQEARRRPRGGPRLLPRAEVPELREPLAARHREPRGQGSVRRRARRRARRARRVPRFRRRDQAPGRDTPSASATATCSRCTSASPTRIRTSSRCASIPPRTTPWAGSGWTTT